MADQHRESRMAQLLHAYGVRRQGDPPSPNTMSAREAADKCGVSRETLGRLIRAAPGQWGNGRVRSDTLDKIAEGLNIPRDLLEREMMADWGFVEVVTGEDLRSVVSALDNLSERDLLTLQHEILRLQQSRLED